MIRALARCPAAGVELVRTAAERNLACWNWAVKGDDPNAAPIDELYQYANSGGNLVVNGGPTMAQLLAAREPAPPAAAVGPLAYPGLAAPAVQLELTAIRTAYALVKANALDAAKKREINALSHRLTRIIAQCYGLPVADADTGIEIGMHGILNPARSTRTVYEWVVGPDGRNVQRPRRGGDGNIVRRPETDAELAERAAEVGLQYEHWWIRFGGGPFDLRSEEVDGPVVETWVNRTHIRWARRGQDHTAVNGQWRVYVSDLQPMQVQRLTAILLQKKGAPLFAHPALRRPWQADNARTSCTWCERDFTFTLRRHHCRACGLLFCADCSSKTENVALPASEDNAAAAGVVRVCDTCYTGND